MADAKDRCELPLAEARRRLKAMMLLAGSKPDPVEEISQVLAFFAEALTPLLARLADFAKDPGDGARDCESARRLGARLARLAAILESQDEAAWLAAATRVCGPSGWKGWRLTCSNIASSPSHLSAVMVAADHLAAAGDHLQACGDTASRSSVQARALDAVSSLTAAATAWNEAVARPRRHGWMGPKEE
jgi:hypothetical protein